MDVKKLINAAGATLGRIIQQAEEAFLDIPKTEYSTEYKENIKKVDFLIILTEKMIVDFEQFLQNNTAYSGEVKIMDNVIDLNDKITYLEEFGMTLQNPLEEIKFYSPLLDKNLLKVGKYQIRLGEAFKDYIKKEGEVYIKKLKKLLEIDLKRFKDEEINLENLRLDHDYLKNRMENAYTPIGRDALEKEYEKVKNNFESYLEKTTQLFQTVNGYFTTHRILLKEFVEIQRNYYRECDKYLTNLLRKMYSGSPLESHVDIQPHKISTEYNINSPKFDNDVSNGDLKLKSDKYNKKVANGKVEIHGDGNLNFKSDISVKDHKPDSTEDNEILTSQVMTSENTALEISDENVILTGIDSGLLINNEIKTDKTDLSLNSSIDINVQANGNIGNYDDLKESVESEPAMTGVSTNLENTIPDPSLDLSLNIDAKPELNLTDQTNLEMGLQSQSTAAINLIPDENITIDSNINVESELNLDVHDKFENNLSDDVIQPIINENLENIAPELSLNIQTDLELKQNVNLDEAVTLNESISMEPIKIDGTLTNEISEPTLTLNTNSNELESISGNLPEINSNLEISGPELTLNISTDPILKMDSNLDTTISLEYNEPDLDLKIDTSPKDIPLDIKSDINLSESIKVENDISTESIEPNINLSAEHSIPDLSLNIQTSSVEEPSLANKDVGSVDPQKTDITQTIENPITDLSVNVTSEIGEKNEVKIDGELLIKTDNSLEIDSTLPNIIQSTDENTTSNLSTSEKKISESDVKLETSLDTNIDFEKSLNTQTEIEKSPEESLKIEDPVKSENDQNINIDISNELTPQLDPQLETKESENDVEKPKENENNETNESGSNDTEKSEFVKTENQNEMNTE